MGKTNHYYFDSNMLNMFGWIIEELRSIIMNDYCFHLFPVIWEKIFSVSGLLLVDKRQSC
jgi:hypothetical protein